MDFECVLLSKDSSRIKSPGCGKRGIWNRCALTFAAVYPSSSSLDPDAFDETVGSYLASAKLECVPVDGEGEGGFMILNANFFEMYLVCSKILLSDSFVFAELLDKGVCLYSMRWNRKEKRFRQDEEKVYSDIELCGDDTVLSLKNTPFLISSRALFGAVEKLSASFFRNYGYLDHGVLEKIVDECCHSSMSPETLLTYRRLHLVKESEMDDANQQMKDMIRRKKQERRGRRRN